MLTGGVTGSLKSARALDMHLGARVILQSILEDELAAGETAPAVREGDSGPYRWRLAIAPAAEGAAARLPPSLPHVPPHGVRLLGPRRVHLRQRPEARPMIPSRAMPAGSTEGQQGFTLVEVLAALALASLILVSLNLASTAVRQGG